MTSCKSSDLQFWVNSAVAVGPMAAVVKKAATSGLSVCGAYQSTAGFFGHDVSRSHRLQIPELSVSCSDSCFFFV